MNKINKEADKNRLVILRRTERWNELNAAHNCHDNNKKTYF